MPVISRAARVGGRWEAEAESSDSESESSVGYGVQVIPIRFGQCADPCETESGRNVCVKIRKKIEKIISASLRTTPGMGGLQVTESD